MKYIIYRTSHKEFQTKPCTKAKLIAVGEDVALYSIELKTLKDINELVSEVGNIIFHSSKFSVDNFYYQFNFGEVDPSNIPLIEIYDGWRE